MKWSCRFCVYKFIIIIYFSFFNTTAAQTHSSIFTLNTSNDAVWSKNFYLEKELLGDYISQISQGSHWVAWIRCSFGENSENVHNRNLFNEPWTNELIFSTVGALCAACWSHSKPRSLRATSLNFVSEANERQNVHAWSLFNKMWTHKLYFITQSHVVWHTGHFQGLNNRGDRVYH